MISKARVLLMDHFLAGDSAKVRELVVYLDGLANEDYETFDVGEKWLLGYWLRDYRPLLTSTAKYDSIELILQNKIPPKSDYLGVKLREKLYLRRAEVVRSIRESDLSEPDKDFLVMHFYSCVSQSVVNQIDQDTLNLLADQFLKAYPNDAHVDFTRRYIRYKLKPVNWGFGYDWFSGYALFTDDLAQLYTNNVPIGFSLDVSFKNVVLYMTEYIGFGFTRHTYVGNGVVWPKDSQVRVYLPEVSLGYVVHEDKRFKLAPFAGLSWLDVSPTEYDLEANPDLSMYDLGFTTSYTVGFNMDIKMGRPNISIVSRGPEERDWFIRLRYAYNHAAYSERFPGFVGNMHYLTIGIGGFGRKLKRDL